MTGGAGAADACSTSAPRRTVSSLFMVVLGIGMGFLMQTTMLIAQNSVEQRDLGVASSAATFLRSIGGSFGVALFGAIFAHRLQDSLAEQLGPAAAERVSSRRQLRPGRRSASLPARVRERRARRHRGLDLAVFLWSVPLAARWCRCSRGSSRRCRCAATTTSAATTAHRPRRSARASERTVRVRCVLRVLSCRDLRA